MDYPNMQVYQTRISPFEYRILANSKMVVILYADDMVNRLNTEPDLIKDPYVGTVLKMIALQEYFSARDDLVKKMRGSYTVYQSTGSTKRDKWYNATLNVTWDPSVKMNEHEGINLLLAYVILKHDDPSHNWCLYLDSDVNGAAALYDGNTAIFQDRFLDRIYGPYHPDDDKNTREFNAFIGNFVVEPIPDLEYLNELIGNNSKVTSRELLAKGSKFME